MQDVQSQPTHANWDLPPGNRWALQHIDRILEVAPVSRGQIPVWTLPREIQELSDLIVFCVDGQTRTIEAVLDRTYTDGFLVIHGGKIIVEHYFNNMTESTLHFSQSVAKSISSTVAGILIDRGMLNSRARLTDYVPELASCGYSGATLNDVLNMRSGVRFTEDYTDPMSDVGRFDRASGWKPRDDNSGPGTIREYILTTKRIRKHGRVFEYRSLEVELAAWVCEAITGKKFPALTGELLWSQLGAECDASFTVDSVGSAIADGGFSATLRDYGRFGLLFVGGGEIAGRQVISRRWVDACRHGDPGSFRASRNELLAHYPKASYSNQWWILDNEAGIICARGANGQLIYVDPPLNLVAVKLSSWPDFLIPEMELDALRAIETIGMRLDRTG